MSNNLPDVELPAGFWAILGLTPVPGPRYLVGVNLTHWHHDTFHAAWQTALWANIAQPIRAILFASATTALLKPCSALILLIQRLSLSSFLPA
jgi:hypothetical protein